MKAQYVHWQEDGLFVAYFSEYPDYWTQAETLDELQENLRDLWKDLNDGSIPAIRRVAEMEVA